MSGVAGKTPKREVKTPKGERKMELRLQNCNPMPEQCLYSSWLLKKGEVCCCCWWWWWWWWWWFVVIITFGFCCVYGGVVVLLCEVVFVCGCLWLSVVICGCSSFVWSGRIGGVVDIFGAVVEVIFNFSTTTQTTHNHTQPYITTHNHNPVRRQLEKTMVHSHRRQTLIL